MERITPIKSPNDTKLYSVIKLENGLQAMLICDPLPDEDPLDTGDRPLVNGFVNEADTVDVLCDVYGANDGDSLGTDSGNSESESGSESDSESGFSGLSSSSGEAIRRGSKSGEKSVNINKLSAVALCVAVGSFSDPDDVPGLAHFLEHMVFMGSRKFPKENGMDKYLAGRGGSNDAYTDAEHTVFSLDVEQKHFEGALDRFANFFVEPLLRKDAVDRETEAVDSEFEIGLPNDKNRVEQLIGSLARASHPMSKFMWGNSETLRTRPKEAGIDVHARLHTFRKQHYVAQNMTLVVQARDSLETLEKWVRTIFSVIPSSLEPKPTFSHLNDPFEPESFNKLYKIIPVKKVNRVVLSWCLPSEQPHYRVKPLGYLSWILGHEGKGSIAAFLSKRLWKYDLVAGTDESETLNNSCCSVFQVSITLSDDGFNHLFEVVLTVFQFLSILRGLGPSQRIFEEIKTIEDNQFRFIEETEPQDYVQDLSLAMHMYREEDYLTGDSLLMEFNEQIIRDFTNSLTPQNMNIMVLSKSFQDSGICNKECAWFKTRYGIEEIPKEWLERWLAPEANDELHIPEPNIYIATQFTLQEPDVPESDFPVIISESPFSRVWYRKDTIFKVPRAFIYVHLTSRSVNQSPRSITLTDLFVKLVEKSLVELTYDAHEADLSYSIGLEMSGVVLKFSGFNENISKLYKIVLDHIVDLKFTDQEFESVVNEWKTIYHNHSLKASRLNTDTRLALLVHNHWPMMDRLSVLPTLSTKDLQDFMTDFLSTATIQMLVQGNLQAQEARELECWLLDRLHVSDRPPPSSSVPPSSADASSADASSADASSASTESSSVFAQARKCFCSGRKSQKPTKGSEKWSSYFVTELPCETMIHRIKNQNQEDDNCVITNYYQHGPASLRQYQMMEMLLWRMSTPLFDTLRTKRQLGYDVSCSVRETHGTMGYSITIGSQSTKFSMKRLDSEIEGFLADRLKKMDRWWTEGSFNRLVKSQIKSKQTKDVNLEEEVDRNWSEIVDGSYVFDRIQREVAVLKDITLPEFRTWCSNHLAEGKERRKLSIQIIGNTVDPKKTLSAPSMFKRSASGLDASNKKKQPRLSNTSAMTKKPTTAAATTKRMRNEDAIPKKNRDASGNIFIKDIAAFKAGCKRYPASQII